MKRTKIDWADSTWNPVTGCLHGCAYCYADRMARRFGCHMKPETDYPVLDYPVRCTDTYDYMRAAGISAGSIQPYPYDFTPTFHKYRLKIPQDWKKPQNIFVCSMADLFGKWVPDDWIDSVITACLAAPQHRYLFLTKNPIRYAQLGVKNILIDGDRFWYGSSTPRHNDRAFFSRPSPESHGRYFRSFLSIEPMLERFGKCDERGSVAVTDWVIVGAETGNRKDKVIPQKEWILELAEECDKRNKPIFMKESLRELMGSDFRQEFPWKD